MDGYVTGKPASSTPLWELVVSGRAHVLGKPVREAAHAVVAHRWPKSLPVLEVARIALEINSDLGLIAARFQGEPANLRVIYAVNMIDAKDPAFIDRMNTFDGPKDEAALRDLETAVVPDLTASFFDL
jgi:hypothetical protein